MDYNIVGSNSIYHPLSFLITIGLFISLFLIAVSSRKKFLNYYLLKYKSKPNPFSFNYLKEVFFSQEEFMKKYRRNWIVLLILFILSALITSMLS